MEPDIKRTLISFGVILIKGGFLIEIALIITGLFFVLAAINNWNLAYLIPQAESWFHAIGKTQTRILYAAFGLVLMASGFILSY